MADISHYKQLIEVASRGEDVRDAIIGALEALNEDSVWTADDVPTQGSRHPITSGGAYNALASKQDVLVFDSTPAQGSQNPVTSGGIYDALQNAQGTIDIDDEPTEGSENPVSSGGVYDALQDVQVSLDFDNSPTSGSDNPVTSDGIYNALRSLKTATRLTSITLGTEWQGNDPYTQAVTLSNITGSSKVDLQPAVDAIHQFIIDGVRAIWIQNDNGVLTAYCIGGHPSVQMTIQCTVESIVDDDIYDLLAALQRAIAQKQNKVWLTTVALTTTWEGSDPYTQEVSIPGVNDNCLIDPMPGIDLQARLLGYGISAMYIDNTNGVQTVTVAGAAPTAMLILPVLVTEVSSAPAT